MRPMINYCRGHKAKKRLPVFLLPDLVCTCLIRERTPTPPTLETIDELEEDSIGDNNMVCVIDALF